MHGTDIGRLCVRNGSINIDLILNAGPLLVAVDGDVH